MGYFEAIQHDDHELVVFCNDKETGLRAIIGVHDTTLGPALGGCRFRPYGSEEEALKDVLRLSRAMTLKSSLAGLNLGGGKTVVMLDHPEQKTPELLKALATRIGQLNGTYIGAGDIGSDTSDLHIMKQVTPWITGLAKEDGGLGDSAILTSLGVFMGIRASVKEKFGSDDLNGLTVALQGVGKVGFLLLEHLVKAGCTVSVSDVNERALQRIREQFPTVAVKTPEELMTMEVDLFSPNAVGGVITPEVAQQLKVKVVAGGANNILMNEEAGQILKQRNILFAPDFVVNAGGVIMVACEIEKLSYDVAREKTENIYNTTLNVFQVAREEDVTTYVAAKRIATRRIEATIKKPRQRFEGVVERRQPAILC